MSEQKNDPAPAVERSELAKGAGLTALSRLGALIEVVAQPAYTWMFGIANYGLYVVLWASINMLSNLFDLSMLQALQRIVPRAKTEAEAHGAVKFALLATLIPSSIAALFISLAAFPVARLFSVAPDQAADVPIAIALFAWSLPLWILLEVATSAARARRAFGPEIRLRIFWEQLARLGFAALLFAGGVFVLGLIIAHLLSLLVTGILSLQLLTRYYDWRLLVSAPMPQSLKRDMLKTGFATMPPNLTRRAFNDLPPIILNMLIPGSGGAVAAGLYGIARKIASVPLIVRQTFLYVLAPLSSAQAAVDRKHIAPLYRFSNRLSAVIVIPLAGLIIILGRDILSVFEPAAAAALPVLVILVIGRAGEAILGPATPIVEMIGHRILPLVNSLAGLAIAAILAFWLTPDMGAAGMAIAVAVGVTVASWAAVVELALSDRLSPFDLHFIGAFFTGLLALGLLYGLSAVIPDSWKYAEPWILLAAFFPLQWLGLKIGLDDEDKEALGSVARTLRL